MICLVKRRERKISREREALIWLICLVKNRERERKRRERERERDCVFVCLSVVMQVRGTYVHWSKFHSTCTVQRKRECVCVCVCERERIVVSFSFQCRLVKVCFTAHDVNASHPKKKLFTSNIKKTGLVETFPLKDK